MVILYLLGFHDSMAENAASHLGKCQGITTLLRGVPNIAKSHKAVLLPSDLMKKVENFHFLGGLRVTNPLIRLMCPTSVCLSVHIYF